MKYFICYDISSDAWRDKLARLLAEQGCRRVQKSVFVAVDFTPRELTGLRQLCLQRIAPHLAAADSVLCLPVENDLATGVGWHGENRLLQEALQKIPVKFF